MGYPRLGCVTHVLPRGGGPAAPGSCITAARAGVVRSPGPVLDWCPDILPCPAPESRNVEEVCRFPELPARKPLTYQAKQLIAREIEVEKMRRVEALARARDGPQVSAPRGWQGRAPRVHAPGRGPAWSALTVLDFLQVDGGPLGGTGGTGVQPPAPCSHKQRLECVLKGAALEEQVPVDVGAGPGGQRVGPGGCGPGELGWAGSEPWSSGSLCSAR